MPEIKGREFAITSDEAFLLPALPERVLVVGGGYIACEFAGIFAGLGIKTVQAYRGDALLRGFDQDVRGKVGKIQEINGIDLKFGGSPTEIKRVGGGYKVSFDDGSALGTDMVMMATGRRPHTVGLGLDKAGIKIDKNGAVIVDEFSQTSQKNIYAVGDVTDRVNLTPVAIREAMAFIDTVYKDNPRGYDHSNIASAVFTRPPAGTVGLTESEAKEAHGSITVYQTDFRPMANVLSGSQHRCYMKLITAGKKETVVGIHLVGDYSGELIQALGIAVKAGLTKADFDATCAVHPTLAEEIVTLSPRKDS